MPIVPKRTMDDLRRAAGNFRRVCARSTEKHTHGDRSILIGIAVLTRTHRGKPERREKIFTAPIRLSEINGLGWPAKAVDDRIMLRLRRNTAWKIDGYRTVNLHELRSWHMREIIRRHEAERKDGP